MNCGLIRLQLLPEGYLVKNSFICVSQNQRETIKTIKYKHISDVGGSCCFLVCPRGGTLPIKEDVGDGRLLSSNKMLREAELQNQDQLHPRA